MIGIMEDSMDNLVRFRDSAYWDKAGYQYCGGNGYLDATDRPGSFYDCTFCEETDILEMILDLNNLTLQYIINGQDDGPQFTEIKQTKYRLACSMSNAKGTKFAIL